MRRRRLAPAALVVTAALVAGFASVAPLFAADGVIEINQVRALAGGVTPIDDAGFPVRINQPGSYVLTGNLDVRGQANPHNVTAIRFEAGSEGATLDLNGFTLLGPNAGCQANCFVVLGASGNGIRIESNFVSVQNGTVHGFGSTGVLALQGGGTLSNLRSIDNGGSGFSTAGHLVRSCEATWNRSDGFVVSNAAIDSSRAVANKGRGFNLDRATAVHSLAINNLGFGVRIFSGSFRDGVSSANDAGSVDCFSATFLAANQFDEPPSGSCTQVEPNYCGQDLCP